MLLVIGAFYLSATAPLRDTYQVEPAALTVPPPDSAVLARGRHVAQVRDCTGCHGEDLSGLVMMDNLLIGTLPTSNLTGGQGGIGQRYTETDWVRALRHGINPEGKSLLIMPAVEFAQLGREDLAALIAYLKQLPPVDKELPNRHVGPMLPIVAAIAKFPLTSANRVAHDAPIPSTPEEAVTAEYGAYLAVTCQGCHGDDYTGRNQMGTLSSNLTRLDTYTEADFITAVRQGVRPTGDSLGLGMPRWSHFTDLEVLEKKSAQGSCPLEGEAWASGFQE